MNAPLYRRGYSFSGFQSNQPQRPLPAQQLDIELDSIARSFASQQAQIQALRPGGGTPGPVVDLPIAGRSLKVNLLSSPAIPQVVLLEQFKAELGIGAGGGSTPEWADIQNKPVFGNASLRNVGAAAGTVAAGDDPRILGALQASQNGNDIPNKGLFRSNLGLGAAALLGVGTGAGTVAAGDDPRFANTGQKTILDYGGKADGVFDNASAMNAQYAAEKKVVIPASTAGCYFNGAVGSLTDNLGIEMLGLGGTRSKLLFGPAAQINLSGVGWKVKGLFGVPAGVVACAFRSGTGTINHGSIIRDNIFEGFDGGGKYFDILFDLYNCWYMNVEANYFYNGGTPDGKGRGTTP